MARSLLDAMGEHTAYPSPIMVFSDTYATFSCLINDLRYIILLSLVQWPRGAGNQRFGRIVCKMLKGQGVNCGWLRPRRRPPQPPCAFEPRGATPKERRIWFAILLKNRVVHFPVVIMHHKCGKRWSLPFLAYGRKACRKETCPLRTLE